MTDHIDGSGRGDAVRLGALGALDDLELDPLALFEALVPVHLDGRVVDEDVLAPVDGDEAETLFGVEPLHGALCHVCSCVSCVRTAPPDRRTGSSSSARRTRTWNSNRARRYSRNTGKVLYPRRTNTGSGERCLPPIRTAELYASGDEAGRPGGLQGRVHAVGRPDHRLERVERLEALARVEHDGLLGGVQPAVLDQLAQHRHRH